MSTLDAVVIIGSNALFFSAGYSFARSRHHATVARMYGLLADSPQLETVTVLQVAYALEQAEHEVRWGVR